jgi:hypothetical protein
LTILLKLAGFRRKFSPGTGLGYTQFFATNSAGTSNPDWETWTIATNTNPNYSSYVPPTIPISESNWNTLNGWFTTQSQPIYGWTYQNGSNYEGVVDNIAQAKNLAVLHRFAGFRQSTIAAGFTQWFPTNSTGSSNPDWNTTYRTIF